MKRFLGLVLFSAFAANANDQEIQKALIQRDQQTAEFAARVRGMDTSALEQLHARQLLEVSRPLAIQPEWHPYQRQRMADERALVLPPPVTMITPPEKPLPLPGGPKHGVDPIPVQGTWH
jgi:hypothetical protein